MRRRWFGMGQGRRASPGVGLVTVLLALTGAVVLYLATVEHAPVPPTVSAHDPPPAGSRSGSVAAAHGADRDTSDRLRGPLLASSVPTTLNIPRIHVRSALVRLGLDGSGAMEVPVDPDEAGWFTGAPTPGSLGPAVIAGHVTWDRYPAVFFRLAELRRGDRVEVLRRDGQAAVFAVSGVRRFSKARFPTDAVYGPTHRAALRLITCGGQYDEGAARYEDNVVVFAELVDVRRRS